MYVLCNRSNSDNNNKYTEEKSSKVEIYIDYQRYACGINNNNKTGSVTDATINNNFF